MPVPGSLQTKRLLLHCYMSPFQSFCVWIRQNMAKHPTCIR